MNSFQTYTSYCDYVGSGPYCYANSFAMMMGHKALPTAVIEFTTCSPFGMQIVGDSLPFFDPYGWDPEASFENALTTLGWTSTVAKGGEANEALARLKTALLDGPVWVGPVELGHLRYQPGKNGPLGADHYMIVLDVDDERALLHDPQGYPFASLPLDDFMLAWRAESIVYGEPYTMRTGFTQVTEVTEEEAIKATIPFAIQWLSMEGEYPMPPGSLGNGEAALALAALLEAGCDGELLDQLIHFAVRVGARRAADAATCLSRIGATEAAKIALEQARLIGSLQHPLTTGDNIEAAVLLRNLAPTYGKLHSALVRNL